MEVASQNYHAAKAGRLFTAQTNHAAMMDFVTVRASSIMVVRIADHGLLMLENMSGCN